MGDRYVVVFDDIPRVVYGPFDSVAEAVEWGSSDDRVGADFDVFNLELVTLERKQSGSTLPTDPRPADADIRRIDRK